MAEVSRKHHTISKFYLARFTDSGTKDGRLWVYDLKEQKCFRQKPKNLAYEIDFNSLDGQTPDAIEKIFGQLEGKTAAVFRQICNDDQLPDDEALSYVMNLMALFAVHNPAMRRSMTATRHHTHRIILDLLASDRNLYESHLRRARASGFVSGPDLPFEQMRQAVRTHKPIEIRPQEHLQTELGAFQHILEAVSSRYWCLAIASPDAPDLITCDHPVSLFYKQLVFPLGPRHALIGNRGEPGPSKMIANAAAVAEMNSRILKLVDRQVYSRKPEVAVLSDREILKVDLTHSGSARAG